MYWMKEKVSCDGARVGFVINMIRLALSACTLITFDNYKKQILLFCGLYCMSLTSDRTILLAFAFVFAHARGLMPLPLHILK